MSSRNQLDLDILPEEARKEIEDFYEFLLKKYGVKRVRDKKSFFESVKSHSFNLPEDYKFEMAKTSASRRQIKRWKRFGEKVSARWDNVSAVEEISLQREKTW